MIGLEGEKEIIIIQEEILEKYNGTCETFRWLTMYGFRKRFSSLNFI